MLLSVAPLTGAHADDSNGPLRGAERDIWEGGTRVPFIVRWPGQAPAGMIVTDEVIFQVDIFPTIAAILGRVPATTAPDGESFLNVGSTKRRSMPPIACPATCGLCL
jgi:N-acetylgalactosamine-6-sulfatase